MTDFDRLRVCVLIPTYNNATTLAGVIRDVAAYTQHIIVVNDGSTDETATILQSFPFVQVISYPTNVGKGWALRQGFAFATERGYDYAITIDSDGQHFAYDLPVFMKALATKPDTILIGARNMDQPSVPGKSSFGHKFSNFWFWVETGLHSPDCQSGYRLYPLQALKKRRFLTRKFEFETEVLVTSYWKGIAIEWVPVSVYYAPPETRVSHFRPFTDFTRITILNTVYVIWSFLYIKPRDFFRLIFVKKKARPSSTPSYSIPQSLTE